MMIERLRATLAIGFIACIYFWPVEAWSQYRLQAGDVVELSVAGVPEMRQRAPIQMDGSVSFPVAGTVSVEGQTLPELRRALQAALTRKVMRVRLNDGRETARTVEPDDVAVSILEYKPIFVTGEVVRAGEQIFRPRMTARQAIVAAGGTLANVRATAPLADVPNLRSAYIAAWVGAATEEARLLRIRMELGESVDFKLSLPGSPVAESIVSEIMDLERDTAAGRNAAQKREKEYFTRAIKEADQQITVLSEQQEAEDEGAKADVADLKRAMELHARGLLPNIRVSDYRRSVLLSSTRKLQTLSQLLQVKRTRAEFVRVLEKLDDDRRVQLIGERRDAVTKIALEKAKLQGADEKLRAAGLPPPQQMDNPGRIGISIIRGRGNTVDRLIVDQDFELTPGDVVEVTIGGDNTHSVNLDPIPEPAP